jgi:flagellar protein FlgJ
MSTPAAAASVYTDFSGFGALRRDARANSPEALRAVAQQFEALFLNMIFKGMRDGKLADDLLGGEGEEMYRELHDQQMALHLAQTNSLGIADMMVRQLERSLPQTGMGDATVPARPVAGGGAPTAAYAPAPREPRLNVRI